MSSATGNNASVISSMGLFPSSSSSAHANEGGVLAPAGTKRPFVRTHAFIVRPAVRMPMPPPPRPLYFGDADSYRRQRQAFFQSRVLSAAQNRERSAHPTIPSYTIVSYSPALRQVIIDLREGVNSGKLKAADVTRERILHTLQSPLPSSPADVASGKRRRDGDAEGYPPKRRAAEAGDVMPAQTVRASARDGAGRPYAALPFVASVMSLQTLRDAENGSPLAPNRLDLAEIENQVRTLGHALVTYVIDEILNQFSTWPAHRHHQQGLNP